MDGSNLILQLGDHLPCDLKNVYSQYHSICCTRETIEENKKYIEYMLQ